MSMFKSVSLCFPSYWRGSSLNSCWTYNLSHFPLSQGFLSLSAEMKASVPFNFLMFSMTQKCPGACTEHPWSCWKLDTNFNALLFYPPAAAVCHAGFLSLVCRRYLTSTRLQQHGINHRGQMPRWCEGWCSRHTREFALCTGKRLTCVHECAAKWKQHQSPHARVLLPASTMVTPRGALHNAINSQKGLHHNR